MEQGAHEHEPLTIRVNRYQSGAEKRAECSAVTPLALTPHAPARHCCHDDSVKCQARYHGDSGVNALITEVD